MNGVLRSRVSLYLLSAALMLAVFSLSLKPPVFIKSMSSGLSDIYYNFNRHTPDNKLVFIEIENSSVRQFGRWPWRRATLAQGLERLEQAKVIGLDMLFSETTWGENDQILANSLQELPVIGGVFLNGPLLGELDSNQRAELANSALLSASHPSLLSSEKIELPIPLLQQAMPALAALSLRPDNDHLVRNYPIAMQVGDLTLPNLATQMWRFANNSEPGLVKRKISFGKKRIPANPHGQVQLNFYQDSDWQRITFAELMADDWQPERLAGAWVVVGISEAGVTDLHATPVGLTPGPLLHLTLLANVLDGSLIKPATGIKMFGLMVFSWITIMFTWRIQSHLRRWLVWMSHVLVLFAAGILAYRYLNIWVEIFYPLLLLTVWLIWGEAWQLIQTRSESLYLRRAFSSYVEPSLVNKIVKKGEELHLGGQRQQLTVLFSDLRDFTPTTEAMETEELVKHLNEYFGCMIKELHRYRGTLDKLMGDAVMALFNAPIDDNDHAYHACLSAAAMMYSLQQFNRKWPNDPARQLRMGIGINTGDAIVGNIGAAGRFNYTAIGDAVNVAARLESAVKEVDEQWRQRPKEQRPCERVDILIGANTYNAVKERLPCYPIDKLSLKGKSIEVEAWVLDWKLMQHSGLLAASYKKILRQLKQQALTGKE